MKIVLDLETTGVSTDADEILQCSIISETGEVLYNKYFKPEHKTEWPEAAAVNGITPDMVKDKPHFKEAAKEVEAILNASSALIGCNPQFDIEFLNAAGISASVCPIDVQEIYRGVYPGRKKRLSCMAEHLGYDWGTDKAHDGLSDCKATLFCYNTLCNRRPDDVKIIVDILEAVNPALKGGEYDSAYAKIQSILQRAGAIGYDRHVTCETPAGTLIAYCESNLDYPSAGIQLKPKGTTDIVDIAFAECKATVSLEEGETEEDLFLYTYDDVSVEDYQHKAIIRREDVIEVLSIK